MCARLPCHQFGAGHHDAKRQTGSNSLRERDDIGLAIEVFEGKHLSRSSHSALHFIRNQKNAIVVRDLLKTLQEMRRWDDVSALSLNGLNNNRGNFIGRHGRSKDDIFQIFQYGFANGLRVSHPSGQ